MNLLLLFVKLNKAVGGSYAEIRANYVEVISFL